MGQLVEEDDDTEWAARNEHWLSHKVKGVRYSPKRERRREPLILCGRGVSLKVDKGTLLIRDGFTHWPQERTEHRFFKGSLELPPRIVMIDGSGSVTFDVITWLSEQRVPLVQLNYRGEAVSVIGGSGYAGDPHKIQWQIDTRNDPERRLKFSCDLIVRKLESCLVTLRDVIPARRVRDVAIAHTENAIDLIERGTVRSIEELRIVEARAAACYFNAWNGLPLVWRSRWKHPVPDAWLTIGARGSSGKARHISNRHAKHPVNAMLNYAYGMLNSQSHIEAVAQGYDPRRGIMHHDRDDGDAFAWVFDMVEPRRAQIDAQIIRFIQSEALVGSDIVMKPDGTCRLSPGLSRSIALVTA